MMQRPPGWDFDYYRRHPDLLWRHYRFCRRMFYLSGTGFILLGLTQATVYLVSNQNNLLLHDVGVNSFGLCSTLAVTLGTAINWVRLEMYLLALCAKDEQVKEVRDESQRV